MTFEFADRLRQLPPYLFAEIDRKKKQALAAGRAVINLGIGDPDRPTPEPILEALAQAARDPATHTYALDDGDPAFRRAIREFMERRYGVALDVEGEIYPTIGSKEAIAHFPLAFVNPGDVCLIPEPGYPPYRSGTLFAGGEPVYLKLREEKGFLPDLAEVAPEVARRAKIIYVNYPNSPTGVVATREFYADLVAFARRYDLAICQDQAYGEMVFEGEAISLLALPGARERAIEFHSLSKTFNMTGWRVGWACGNRRLVAGLGQVKANCDSGIFTAIQRAGAVALRLYDQLVPPMVALYRQRRDVFCGGLNRIGWPVRPPAATFYVWIKVPPGYTSEQAAARLLDECDLVMTPGNGFGSAGEGYVRATLCSEKERLAEAVARISRVKW